MTIRAILASALMAPSLMLAACAGGASSETQIMGVTWVADEIGGTPVLPDSEVTLTFNPDGRSGGKGGCNTYGAGYQRNGNALTFEQAMSTQMFCAPDALMAQEHAYLNLLPQVTGFERSGDKLTLNTPAKSILFHAKP
ncbi:META domain-containing protein [Dongia rigui]|uniref:META domain-containing protein n=1 Tax=Dongia rigui TaxID=940149 RepID=A0ABU5E0N3_9PROT|nr:META domain-containing protein [Dongia rigui]MDY0872842.1 META domain-containing protein [Dongia rigui]